MIRDARSDDVAAIAAVVSAAYSPFEPLIGRTPAPMLDDYEALVAAGRVRVYTEDGVVVGAIVAWPHDGWYVDNIAVDPATHRHGVGSALLADSERIASGRGMARVWLYTNAVMSSNVGFYERRGYLVTERRIDRGYDRIFFSKSI